MSRLFDPIQSNLTRMLIERGYSFDKPAALAQAVQRLSDFYLANPLASTPWHEPWAQAAYLAYYLPLNFARVHRAVAKAKQTGFFDGLNSLVDFGSGLGAGQLAVASQVQGLNSMICHDLSPIAMSMHAELARGLREQPMWWKQPAPDALPKAQSRLAVLSYVFTELKSLPQWVRESEGILIIEPSTREDGRRLQALRGELLAQGYSAFAPCPHQQDCPLLVDSERDWCHDRVEFTGDAAWAGLEQHLPMKNRTLTYSYLAVRKTARPSLPLNANARMVGDKLPEKGKTRQLLCRGPEREFLSWFPQRLKTDLDLERGDLVRLEMEKLEARNNELRIKDLSILETVPFPKTQL